MKNWYKNIEAGFLKLDPAKQILHMVSDIQKAENLSLTSPESANNHLYRAIILLDYIVSDPKWQHRLHELLRLREVIASLIIGTSPYGSYADTVKAALLLERAAYRTLNSSQVSS